MISLLFSRIQVFCWTRKVSDIWLHTGMICTADMLEIRLMHTRKSNPLTINNAHWHSVRSQAEIRAAEVAKKKIWLLRKERPPQKTLSKLLWYALALMGMELPLDDFPNSFVWIHTFTWDFQFELVNYSAVPSKATYERVVRRKNAKVMRYFVFNHSLPEPKTRSERPRKIIQITIYC